MARNLRTDDSAAQASPPIDVTVRVRDVRAYSRVLHEGSVGLGESYADGWWDTDDLTGLANRSFFMARMHAALEREDSAGGALLIIRVADLVAERTGLRFTKEPLTAAQIAEIEAGRAEPRLEVGDLSKARDFLDVRDVVVVGTRTRDEVLRLAAAVEHASEHPIARAVVGASTGPLPGTFNDNKPLFALVPVALLPWMVLLATLAATKASVRIISACSTLMTNPNRLNAPYAPSAGFSRVLN